jgi:hypothetical protein
MEAFTTYAPTLLVILAALAAFIFGVAVFYPWLRKKQGYYREEELEAIILPFVYNAICAAYKVSEMAIDEGMSRLDGLDKKAIADAAYAMLPDSITLPGGKVIPIGIVKQLAPRETWEQWVQNAFDSFATWYASQDSRFEELFEQWAAENAPRL